MKYKNIILLTDFGNDDNFIGVMKGVMLKINPDINFIDITHNIPPQNILKASFLLKNSYKFFPEKSIFLTVVDPGVGTNRDILFFKYKKLLFIAPDNGVLSEIIKDIPYPEVFKLKIPNRYIKIPVSSTFHGRDIFSPLAAYISKGITLKKLGKNTSNYKKIYIPAPKILQNSISGEIIYIDKFGNCISNISADQIKNNNIKILIKNKRIKGISENYQSVSGIGAIVNSFNLIEIFVKNNSAAQKFKIREHEKIVIGQSRR